jgi:predicted nucleic acid-binding protein
VVRTSDGDRLVTVPAPWRDPDHGERPVEMLVDPKLRSASPISVTVRDPRLGSGLAYFAAGALDLAGQMFNSSEQLLFEKLENPLAAAAAGYVLVGTDDGRDTPAWYRWLDNLANWVDWLPDGRILAATNQLRQADDRGKRRAARDSLLAAFASGVPFYTFGLRWLVDGLSRFAKDAEVDAAIDTVRRFSYRVDMTQPFVIVKLDKESR